MVSDLSTTTPLHPMMGWRYSLTRCLGRTALADVYWARDLEVKDTATPDAHVLLLKVSSALSQLNGFEDALYEVLMPFTESSSSILPIVTDSGNDNGNLWLVLPHTEGKLFSEYLHGGKDTHRLLQELKVYLSVISSSLNQLLPPTYGFLEPAALQLHNGSVRLLNAPLVYALRHYIEKTAHHVDYRLTLNSSYISPAVAVGDVPKAEDDVFSLAAMAYHFLTGEAPFKKQHTLEAVVRHTQVSPIKGLSTHAQETLQQGLTLQPGQRQASPALFIKQLTKRSTTNILLSTAVAAAVTITGLAVHHLAQRAETYLDPHTTVMASVKPGTNNESAANTKAEPATHTPPQSAEAQPPIAPAPVEIDPTTATFNALSNELKQQFVFGSSANLTPIVDKIRSQLSSSTQRETWLPLLDQAIQHEHTQAQSLLDAKDLVHANTLLNQTNQWIKEFSLTQYDMKQASLEQLLKSTQAEQLAVERLLAQAQDALSEQRWTAANGEQNAALFLTQVLTRQPEHPEANYLLLETVKKQQAAIQQQISAKTIQDTQSLLTDTSELINQYKLELVASNQAQLEASYQTLKTAQPELVVVPNTEVAETTEVVSEQAATDNTSTETDISSKALSAQDITQALAQAASLPTTATAVVATPTPATINTIKTTAKAETPTTVYKAKTEAAAPTRDRTDRNKPEVVASTNRAATASRDRVGRDKTETPRVQKTVISEATTAKRIPVARPKPDIQPTAVTRRPVVSRQPEPVPKAEPARPPRTTVARPATRRAAPSRPAQQPSYAATPIRPRYNRAEPAVEEDYMDTMRRADRARIIPVQTTRRPIIPPQYRRAEAPRRPIYSAPDPADELIEVPLSTLLD
ncbi:hypothetical protein [Thiofilum flexile]|uniref:hypothetical protein n=1 Tax=Thiofilum flexile TaxID=125627 RepID=UPI00036F8AD2|nr:hypothetical protein [Thiofilum flexile]